MVWLPEVNVKVVEVSDPLVYPDCVNKVVPSRENTAVLSAAVINVYVPVVGTVTFQVVSCAIPTKGSVLDGHTAKVFIKSPQVLQGLEGTQLISLPEAQAPPLQILINQPPGFLDQSYARPYGLLLPSTNPGLKELILP